MTPPLSKYHLEILNKEFYTNLQFFGRDKLYNIMKEKYADKAMSRCQVAEWLSQQEVNQKYHPSKGKPVSIKSSMTNPNTILAIDLVNIENMR
jgi:hypothetical protein